jgi:DNA-binding response OmpR family regulator
MKYIVIICLSLAVAMASAKPMYQNSSQQKSKDEPKKETPQMQGDLRSLPVTSKEMQLVFFAGLSVVFVVMVGILFRKYRGKRKISRREAFNDAYYDADRSTFTPTFFSSESTPAILVAQNHNDLRLFITNTLRLNYRVISTGDGHEACEKAIEVVPDLIIIDRFMPGMDGPMICRKLKSTEATSHIPIVILTSSERDLMTSDWHQYADDVLHSSFDARELLIRVHNLISLRKKQQEEYRRHIRVYPFVEDSGLPEFGFLKRVLTVLDQQYNDPGFGVDQLTDKLSMSRLQLYRKLKALTTHAPGEFIRQYRLEQAKQLLSKETASVVDVASRTGFANLSTFSKAFKDYTGKSPVEFVENSKASDEFVVED